MTLLQLVPFATSTGRWSD